MEWTEIEYLNMNRHFCHFTVTCLCFCVVFEMLKISSYAKIQFNNQDTIYLLQECLRRPME